MQKWLEKYQTYITVALILFIALGGIVLLYQEQRDKVTLAEKRSKVQEEGWRKEKDELSQQIDTLQKQVSQLQNTKTAMQPTVAGSQTANTAITGLININTADAKALDTLPAIGETKAQAIIDYRNQKGGFKKISDLKEVKGIGDATFEKLKDKITI